MERRRREPGINRPRIVADALRGTGRRPGFRVLSGPIPAGIRIGDAIGPNKPGLAQEASKEEILSSLKNDSDPLSDTRLPKDQQDHVREFFKRFESGE